MTIDASRVLNSRNGELKARYTRKVRPGETIMETVQAQSKNKVSIHINKDHFFIEVPITGAQLRVLGKIPPENQLFREIPGEDPDELIRDEVEYDVKPGTHFYDLPRGTVGEAGLPAPIAHAVSQLPNASAARQPDGMHLLRWAAQLPTAWTPDRVELVVLFPPLFPAQAPSGFDLVGEVRMKGAVPGGTGMREVAGLHCMHFCWNPAGAIDYAAEDAAWRFAKFSETRFLQLQ